MSPKPVKRGYKGLRDMLLQSQGRSRQWLSQRVHKVIQRVPVPVPIAQAVVAHHAGIRVDRFLSPADLADVQQALRDLGARPERTPGSGSEARPASQSKRAAQRQLTRRTRGPSVPFLSDRKLGDATAMAECYPVLYVIENSIRELIQALMISKYGPQWWETQVNRGKLRGIYDRVQDRRRTEKRNSWHQRRGAHEIDYTDFDELRAIAESKPDLFFPEVFGEQEWFRQFFRELVPSRNVVCHMNPLSGTNRDDLNVKLKRWKEHLRNKSSYIESQIGPAALR